MDHPFMRSDAHEHTAVSVDSPREEPPIVPARHMSALLSAIAKESKAESPMGALPSSVALQNVRSEGGMADPKPEKNNIPLIPVGRRAAPRLRISLPGQLIAVEKVHSCILMNLSRTGAQVAILDSMRAGEGAILRCGMINHFAIVTRSEFGLNAFTFDTPLTDEIVLEIRRYHENFEERERRALIETARKWVNGDSADDRPI